jgi:hypothetical protein
MIFIAGFALGVLATMGAALILAADQNKLDEGDNNN